MFKFSIVILISLFVGACAKVEVQAKAPPAETPIVMTVLEVVPDTNRLGCVNSDVKTVLRSEDGRVSTQCGRFGPVGTSVSGCWVTGYDHYSDNGFRNICNLQNRK